MKHWTLLTPLRFLRSVLHAFVLAATAFAILTAGMLGGMLPYAALQALGVPSSIDGIVAVAGGIAGMVLAYMIGDRLNDRVRRLRAPIGTAAFGADGIRWRHMWTTEFIGWANVRDIVLRGSDVVVLMEGRPDIALQVERRELFVDAARTALTHYRNGDVPQTIAALEFAGDDVVAWLGRARELLRGGSYRDADIGEEQCVRVATDPRAPVAQRIGSAAALSKASDDARQRVRVAIEETADPLVAQALDDALEERDNRRALASILRR